MMNDAMTAKEPSKAKSAILMLICSFTGTKLKLNVKSVLGSRSCVITVFQQALESTGFLFAKLADIPAVTLTHTPNFGKRNKLLHLNPLLVRALWLLTTELYLV